jgi:hypothetical protein
MIARIWRGVVRTEDADVYGKYIDETGFAAYKATRQPGRVAAAPRRRRPHRVPGVHPVGLG